MFVPYVWLKKTYGFQGPEIVEMGIDLSEFYKSVEWDILGVPAARFSTFIRISWFS